MNRKTLIFPFTKKDYFIVYELIRGNNNNFVVSSINESRTIDLDISYAYNKPYLGVTVVDINNVDFLEIGNVIILKDTKLNVSNAEIEAFSHGINNNMLDMHPYMDLDNLFHDIYQFDSNCNSDNIKISHRFFDIDIPVIAVGGITKMEDNQEIIFALKRELDKNGYTSGILINNENAELVGANCYLKSLFSNEISFPLKVIILNELIKSVYIKEKPDVLIIEIAGALCKINSNFLNRFGEFSHILSEATIVDYLICNMSNQFVNEKDISVVKELMKNKYDFPLEVVNISNSEFDWKERYSISDELNVNYLDYNFSECQVKDDEGLIIGNIHSEGFIQEVYNDIVKKC